MEAVFGLLPLHIDRAHGQVWLQLPPPGADGLVGEYLYLEGLVQGLGSNRVGLDRGQLGRTRLVRLRRLGGRLLIEQPNLRFRALSDDPSERRTVAQSFATSVIWGGEIAAEDPDGAALVDLSSFLVRDSHGVARRLSGADQGSFQLDASASAIDLDACLGFPDNVELEVLLTFRADEPGAEVRAVAPSPHAVSLVVHHSLVRLPDDGYRRREFDPRVGTFGIAFQDYAATIDAPLTRRWIARHRLAKVDPGAASSPAVRPIVYHVDPGTPEPIRSALIDGAGWWARAFTAAGFVDAFRVELLPAAAHPLDVRYNVIQWVHRATRGWSYGASVIDPRTGEIIKGHVSLGSLRVRHDRLLFEGLLGADATGSGIAADPVELALARLRQLAAHEVGHTLGLAHNFAASTYGRASVMDYPAPRVRLGADGELDLSAVYGVGVGAWDLHAIRYAYAQPGARESEAAMLAAIVADGLERGLLFLSDADARGAAAAEPRASLWDNGADPVDELREVVAVRRHALRRFGARNVAVGRPLAHLEEALATVYLGHRYQLEAALKVIGGVEYAHAVRGDGQPAIRTIEAERQRAALTAILELLGAAELQVPESALALLQPRPFGEDRSREQFRGQTGPTFDSLAAADTAAALVADGLLQPQRAQRLVEQHGRSGGLSLDEVLDRVVAATFAVESTSVRMAELQAVARRRVVSSLIRLASSGRASASVQVRAEAQLDSLRRRLSDEGRISAAERAWLGRVIDRHMDRAAGPAPPLTVALEAPPGSPIGDQIPADCNWSREPAQSP